MVLDHPRVGDVIVEGLRSPNLGVRLAMLFAILETAEAGGGGRSWLQVHKTTEGTVLDRRAVRIVKALLRLCEDTDDRLRQESGAALEAVLEVIRETRQEQSLVPAGRVSGVRLNEADEDDDDDDGGGWSGSTFDPAHEPESSLEREMAWVAEQAQRPPTRDRFTELRLFHDPEEDAEPEAVPLDLPVRDGDWYLLVVAVREDPGGIPLKGGLRLPISPPPGESLELIAVAEGDGFEVEEPVQSLDLPVVGDSTRDAAFRVRPTRATAEPASIRIRLYYRLNLLESVVLSARVAPKFEELAPTGEAPIVFRQERREQSFSDLQASDPKALHIDVSKRGTSYCFHFAILDDRKRERVAFGGTARLQASDLEDDLVGIRDLWDSIATSRTLTTALEGDEDFFLGQLRNLAHAGQKLWTRLFLQESNSAMRRIGKWLTENPLPTGGTIQVSTAEEAGDFVFPWALLFDRSMPEKAYDLPDAAGFWGLRYCIEQRVPIPRLYGPTAIKAQGPAAVSFFRCQRLRNVDHQDTFFESLRQDHSATVAVSLPPLEEADACYRLLQECEAELLYFYTHGHTRQRRTDSAALGLVSKDQLLESIGKAIETMPEESILRASLARLQTGWRDGSLEGERSWIELTRGRVYLDTLYQQVTKLASRPVVFLNMCESAQVTPFQSQNFAHFFLDRGARAVLGTECCMTTEFADPFAQDVLSRMVGGDSIGEAVRASRAHFIYQSRNPLGLAYSLYGSGAATLVANPPPARQEKARR